MPSMKMRRGLTLAMLALALASSSISGFDMASSVEKQCKATTSCMRGGPLQGPKCVIADEECPKCMTFENGGCFDKVDGKCNFGSDCEPYWTQSEGSDSATTDAPEPSTTSPSSASQGGDSNAGDGTASSASSGSTSSLAGETGAASASKDGPDMVLVFGIVGGGMLMIAVAAIFFVLVRRSRTDDDDDEEMTPTAQIVTKGQPSTTTNAVSYAPYAQRSGANPTTPTNRVIQYYNDNSLPSPHGGRGGGGFGSQLQGQPPVKTVRPAAAANAPTFFKPPTAAPAYSAQPAVAKQQSVYSQPAPYANANTNANTSGPYANSTASYASTTSSTTSYGANNSNAPVYAPAPAAVYTVQPASYARPSEPLFTVHAADEQPPPVVRRESSPRPRRESYEF